MTLANECHPLFEDSGQIRVTGHADNALTGKRLVKLSGEMQPDNGTSLLGGNPLVSPCGAGQAAVGIAAYDVADEGKCPIIGFGGPGTIAPITAGGTVTYGQFVQSDSTGRVVAQSNGIAVGIVLAGATVGNDAMILWTGALGPAGLAFVTAATHIADPSGGGTVDAQARTAIGSILDALEAAGIVAP